MKYLALALLAAGLAAGQSIEEATVSVAGATAALQKKISDVEAQLKALRQRYTEGHPSVKSLNGALDQLRAQEHQLAAKLAGEHALDLGDTWWRNPQVAVTLNVTAPQKQRMEDVFQQYRIQLIELKAALEKEEVILEPLVDADTPDQGKITAQIDRVANARAELEKARGRMLLGIRMVLEPEQWRRLNDLQSLKNVKRQPPKVEYR